MAVGEVAGGLLAVRDVAALLRISGRQVLKLRASGRIPVPLKLGRSTRWRAEEIESWVRAGCPSREVWESRRGGPRG